MSLYNNKGEWKKTKSAKYLHFFDDGKNESLCNLSKNPTIIGGDYPRCPICRQFCGIRKHLLDNQTFGFKDDSFRRFK
jgi:hypothetical protein